MTVARRIGPKLQETPDRPVGGYENLDAMLASIVAIQTGSLGRFEAAAATIAAVAERFAMAETDRITLLAMLQEHVAEIRAERQRLANLQEVTFVFPEEDELLVVVPSAA